LRASLKVHGTGVRALKEDRDALVSWVVLCFSVPLLSCGGGGPGAGTPLQPGVSVRVSPSTDTLTVSHTQQFTATVNGTSDTATTWNVNGILGGNGTTGTISSTGLYAAPVVVPSPATVSVTAVSQADSTKSGSASVTITAPPPLAISISPTSASIQAGQSQRSTARRQDAKNTAVTWQVNGATGGTSTFGTISSSGLYTAPSVVPNPSTVSVTAVSQADSTKSSSASVTITAPPPVAISISPTSASIQAGQSQ